MQRQPNPRRITAGRHNRLFRGPLSDEGRQRLRAAIFRIQPWIRATGPKTTAGKQRSAANGRLRQCGKQSVRQLRAELADVGLIVSSLRQYRFTRQQTANR